MEQEKSPGRVVDACPAHGEAYGSMCDHEAPARCHRTSLTLPLMASISRSQLKAACEQQNWDLLDLLLEMNATHLDDNALFTDTWGDWWGLLMEVIYRKAPDGLRVLLKHGARRDTGRWGDGMPLSPLEAAADQPEILALLQDAARPTYIRQTDPPLPAVDPAFDERGRIHDAKGLAFPPR